jgi:hypothetical protein
MIAPVAYGALGEKEVGVMGASGMTGALGATFGALVR